ncbi:MAG: recombinase RmuC [Candidatus Muproteobacteria bacterium RIFCSPHIGHO2_12_FULL_60_33]|uniref:Recombinase RmuC n=1 Tax=Candidatus Muproteobacteria bacterium RIFCSPLOWO2_01_FULL_60_18 TaxID=1817768 RepID=A0A1F6TYV5_9PROT|nr:MAG: recombinase RmuC [Candidatus Muproteobacteria bacterium RIFCSPHIGHO2_01_60_12]OGI50324.1 MAG: recombinase RmuC [Candidatus Muproteobacteria bacterium RIFCSPLOWO2_01_FULL_60_18]OGI54458.1 MAG: recombinase RmuC [Candidatus Muproteobacteria bacterium RIFCSPHIGHO2_12_FULL_60_33]
MPTEVFAWLLLAGLLAVVVLLIVLLVRGAGRADLANDRARLEQTLGTQIANIAGLQSGQLDRLTKANEDKLAEMRATLEAKLKELQTGNEAKLEQMRLTVDEKLHKTLETRLGESFKLVSERLEAVHKGLGDMQTLAADVGNLQKVLTNVKARGTWGEVQLENLLEQMLTADQYTKNVATKPGSNERVEFAIRLPGRSGDDQPVWLPIDAKFPREDYERLLEAEDRADPVAAEAAAKQLEIRIRDEAKKIHEKYIAPPHTTDFGLLFLPIEGLYAEVLRRPGLTDRLQREYRVTVAGPTTLAALLNSLQMGFRTLAIEKRSSEVWQVLGAVKTEFGKFGELLARTKKQLDTVSSTLGDAESKTRTIERKLRNVEQLSGPQAQALLEDSTESGDA